MSYAPTTPVTIDFGDGKERRLRYTVGVTKRLVEKYGNIGQMFQLPKYEFLPILFDGIMAADRFDVLNEDGTREAFTVEWLEENVALPQMDALMEKFWLAFTGKSIEQITKQIAEGAAKNAQSQATTADPATPTIQ